MRSNKSIKQLRVLMNCEQKKNEEMNIHCCYQKENKMELNVRYT
jgi:hypothetical protein